MKMLIPLFLVLSASSAVSADSWWLWEEDHWCFRTSQKKICLPDDYRATTIAPKEIKFSRSEPIVEPPGFIKFHFEPEHKQPPLIDEAFTLSSEHVSKSVSMAKYLSREQSGSSHLATLFIITLDGKFTLWIFGSDDHAISNLAQSVVRQWEQS